MIGHRAVAIAALGLALCGGLVSLARAEPSASAVREASRHFQRGVTLYNEADYRAALVEFKRAHDIAPNPTVLYNIGQTYFQLQNYAAALTTLDRYLAESGPGAPHRNEVETTIETLQARVGKIAIAATAPGYEIAIDDEVVGKTPLREPVLVSIGRRKVTAQRDNRVIDTRQVDVAAGDTVQLPLTLVDDPVLPTTTPELSRDEGGRGGLFWGWVATGVLGAGAIATTAWAYKTSSDLKTARTTFPADPADLEQRASNVNTRSMIADILWGATIVTGGVTLTFKLTKSQEVRVSVLPNGLQVAGVLP
jgi:tetratricopeptide (TPR) repeat protein